MFSTVKSRVVHLRNKLNQNPRFNAFKQEIDEICTRTKNDIKNIWLPLEIDEKIGGGRNKNKKSKTDIASTTSSSSSEEIFELPEPSVNAVTPPSAPATEVPDVTISDIGPEEEEKSKLLEDINNSSSEILKKFSKLNPTIDVKYGAKRAQDAVDSLTRNPLTGIEQALLKARELANKEFEEHATYLYTSLDLIFAAFGLPKVLYTGLRELIGDLFLLTSETPESETGFGRLTRFLQDFAKVSATLFHRSTTAFLSLATTILTGVSVKDADTQLNLCLQTVPIDQTNLILDTSETASQPGDFSDRYDATTFLDFERKESFLESLHSRVSSACERAFSWTLGRFIIEPLKSTCQPLINVVKTLLVFVKGCFEIVVSTASATLGLVLFPVALFTEIAVFIFSTADATLNLIPGYSRIRPALRVFLKLTLGRVLIRVARKREDIDTQDLILYSREYIRSSVPFQPSNTGVYNVAFTTAGIRTIVVEFFVTQIIISLPYLDFKQKSIVVEKDKAYIEGRGKSLPVSVLSLLNRYDLLLTLFPSPTTLIATCLTVCFMRLTYSHITSAIVSSIRLREIRRRIRSCETKSLKN